MKTQRTKAAPKASPNDEIVLNWDGIGSVLGVSYMTAKRRAKADPRLRAVVRVFRQNYDPRLKCTRTYVYALRSDLIEFLRGGATIADASTACTRGRKRGKDRSTAQSRADHEEMLS